MDKLMQQLAMETQSNQLQSNEQEQDLQAPASEEAAERGLGAVTRQQLRVTRNASHQFSGLTHLIRVSARCLRFRLCLVESQERRARISAPLSSTEVDHAFLACVAWSQRVNFEQQLAILSQGQSLTRTHPMSHLQPVLDPAGIMRVGREPECAILPDDQRHRVILPSRCHLSTLIIDWAHIRALHGGSQLTHAYVLRKAWILRGTSSVKSYVRNCATCNGMRSSRLEQQLGNLPAEQVTATRPFSRVGLDYAGPLFVRSTKGRGHRFATGYVAFFMCLSTKAVHLELVGDLTTNAFLAALRRFAGCRGRPREIWSDDASTFHGTNAGLRALLRKAEIDWIQVADSLAREGIQWSFIPPGAPHFGGLHESAVTSVKSHIKRVIGAQILTDEESYAFLMQIEMCVNSRPLTPISGEVDDSDVLTPGHFLVGTPSKQMPEPPYPEECLIRETRSQLIHTMRDHFWKRWAREYVHTLQQRHRWTHSRQDLQENDMVVVIDPSLLEQGRWPLGHVVTVHLDQDRSIRSVTVKTHTGTYVRPIVKVCKLPVIHELPGPAKPAEK